MNFAFGKLQFFVRNKSGVDGIRSCLEDYILLFLFDVCLSACLAGWMSVCLAVCMYTYLFTVNLPH